MQVNRQRLTVRIFRIIEARLKGARHPGLLIPGLAAIVVRCGFDRELSRTLAERRCGPRVRVDGQAVLDGQNRKSYAFASLKLRRTRLP